MMYLNVPTALHAELHYGRLKASVKDIRLLSQITLWSSRLEPFTLSFSCVVIGVAQSQ